MVALVLIQFIPINKNEGGYESLEPFLKETKSTAEVAALLKRACYDCHSDQTAYLWYAHVAPASFYLKEHIQNAKQQLNFSEWEQYSAKRKKSKLNQIIEVLAHKTMPLESYNLIHTEAQLDTAQTEVLLNWATTARLNYLGAALPQ
ncbi:heme-binding domain-containing protein [Leeuwenhoekiella palythoae]|nr:heme-binding domain-containing protein [Leeuwenhoekiella palythoae]